MKFACPKCNLGGEIEDAKISGSGAWGTCPKCKTRFHINKESQDNDQNKDISKEISKKLDTGIGCKNTELSELQCAASYINLCCNAKKRCLMSLYFLVIIFCLCLNVEVLSIIFLAPFVAIFIYLILKNYKYALKMSKEKPSEYLLSCIDNYRKSVLACIKDNPSDTILFQEKTLITHYNWAGILLSNSVILVFRFINSITN